MKFSAVNVLIAANVVVFALQYLSPGTPESLGAVELLFALWPLQPIDGHSYFHFWQIVTYAFLHDTTGIAHLLFNMLGLWMFGAEIERYVGPRRLLACYFASVVTAALTQLFVPMLFGAPPSPTIGASGGVFGLMLAYAVMFPKRKVVPSDSSHPDAGLAVRDALRGSGVVPGRHQCPAGVAHFAHLGGMVGSALVIMQWRRPAARD